jgi:hypothetical protein
MDKDYKPIISQSKICFGFIFKNLKTETLILLAIKGKERKKIPFNEFLR